MKKFLSGLLKRWRAAKTADDANWQEYENSGVKILIDGTAFKERGLLMRRRAQDGSWEYRLPTQDEAGQNWTDSFM